MQIDTVFFFFGGGGGNIFCLTQFQELCMIQVDRYPFLSEFIAFGSLYMPKLSATQVHRVPVYYNMKKRDAVFRPCTCTAQGCLI